MVNSLDMHINNVKDYQNIEGLEIVNWLENLT